MINLIPMGFLSLVPGTTPEMPFLAWSSSLKLLAINHSPFVTFIAIDKLPYDYKFKCRTVNGTRPWNGKREKAIYGGRGHIVASRDSAIGIIIRRKRCIVEIPLPAEAVLASWTIVDAA